MIDLLIEVLNVSGIKFGDTWLLSPTTNLWGSSMPILWPYGIITTDYCYIFTCVQAAAKVQ